MPKPIIILSRPQLADNIGASARILSNFGFEELRIVAPRDGWPLKKAFDVAANGAFILDDAKIFETLEEAISDINFIFATARRVRNMVKPVLTPRDAMPFIKSCEGKTAILFGSERAGLTNEEINLAEKIIQIPVSEKNPSLNLAQAVAVCCYEYCSNYDITTEIKTPEIAKKEELSHLLEALISNLESKQFFKNPDMKPEMSKNIRNIFSRSHLSSQEVRTLFGIFRCLNDGEF